MRVIAGKAKGLGLSSPKGLSTRPTSGLVRGAIFSMLECSAEDWSAILDLYAGTGALGIEALSRGAGRADFVDKSPRCCAIIKENLEHTRLAGQAAVYCLPVKKALPLLDEKYGIVFMDPPYQDPSIPALLEELTSSQLIGPGATIVVERWRRVGLGDIYGSFRLVKELHHGDTCISVYQFGRGGN
ncbi:16S rRNA (guanine(966)-N(2))-methyltransferase RsmD [Chloroflexota bacterium]